MINGIYGLPGSGKTLEAVRRARKAHNSRRRRVHVYANLPLNLTRFTLISPLDIVRIGDEPCGCDIECDEKFILLDEVHLWLPARRSMQLPMSWLTQFSQTRKDGWGELWYTAQHETRVDRVLKDVSNWFFLVEHFTAPWEYFVIKQYEPEKFRKKHLVRDIRRRSRSASEVYDTRHKIGEADHVKDKNDAYRQEHS